MAAAGLMPDGDCPVQPLTSEVLLLLPAWVWLWRLPVVLPQVTDDEVFAELGEICQGLLGRQGEG